MTDRTDTQVAFGGELKMLAGVWALVCFAVLTTAALA